VAVAAGVHDLVAVRHDGGEPGQARLVEGLAQVRVEGRRGGNRSGGPEQDGRGEDREHSHAERR
jgi:hypothetical protein